MFQTVNIYIYIYTYFLKIFVGVSEKPGENTMEEQNRKVPSFSQSMCAAKVSGFLTGTSRLVAHTTYVTFAYPSNIKNNNRNNHTRQSKQLPNKHFTNSVEYNHLGKLTTTQ